eukprot:139875-Rhodomonas_salina.2
MPGIRPYPPSPGSLSGAPPRGLARDPCPCPGSQTTLVTQTASRLIADSPERVCTDLEHIERAWLRSEHRVVDWRRRVDRRGWARDDEVTRHGRSGLGLGREVDWLLEHRLRLLRRLVAAW